MLVLRWIPAYMAAHGDRRPSLDRRTLMTFVAADSVGALFALGASTLLPVLVVGAVGPTTGAYFAITWTIITALMLVPINMAASLTVESVHTRVALGPQVRRLAGHLYRLLIPLVIAVIVFAEWGLHIFGPAYSENATVALRIGALGLLPFAANTLFLATARIRARSRAILVVQVVTAAADPGPERRAPRPHGHRGRDARLARRPEPRRPGASCRPSCCRSCAAGPRERTQSAE